MRREESSYWRDWFSIGEKELQRAANLLNLADLDGAAFNVQQSVEKYLKGYLLSKGWELRRIHSLEILLNEAVEYEPSLDAFRSFCQKTTLYYAMERYPVMPTSELTESEVRESLSTAEELIRKIKEMVGE